jgi:hypothetical protein
MPADASYLSFCAKLALFEGNVVRCSAKHRALDLLDKVSKQQIALDRKIAAHFASGCVFSRALAVDRCMFMMALFFCVSCFRLLLLSLC